MTLKATRPKMYGTIKHSTILLANSQIYIKYAIKYTVYLYSMYTMINTNRLMYNCKMYN